MQRRMVLISNDEMPREWEIVIYFLALSLESHKKKKDLFHDTFMRRKTIQDLFVDTSNARWCHCRKKFAFALDVLNLICICLGHAHVTSVFDVWIFCFWFSFCVSFLFLPLPPPLLSSFHFLQRYVCLSGKRPASDQHPTAWVRIALDRWESVWSWLLAH